MPATLALPLRFPTPYVRLIADLLARRRVDVAAWQSRHGLGPGALQGAWVDLPAARFVAALRDAVAETGEPALGLLLGERLAAGTHGAVGHAVMHSRTLGEALAVVVRYAALRMPLLAFEAGRDERHWRLTVHPLHALGDTERTLVEATLLAIHRLLGALLVEDSPVEDIVFTHRLGRDRALAMALFACPIREGAETAGLRVPADRLDHALPLADPEAFALAERQCRDELARRDGDATVAGRVRALLEGPLLAHADTDACARLLAMSPRSLERRLAAEGTAFRRLVDERRCARAEAWLRDGRSVEAVASALGYSDAANFRRAFRRWTGQTPAAWRDAARRAR